MSVKTSAPPGVAKEPPAIVRLQSFVSIMLDSSRQGDILNTLATFYSDLPAICGGYFPFVLRDCVQDMKDKTA